MGESDVGNGREGVESAARSVGSSFGVRDEVDFERVGSEQHSRRSCASTR